MAISFGDNVQRSIISLSETAVIQSPGLPATMTSTMSSARAVASATAVAETDIYTGAHTPDSWLGSLGSATLVLIRVIPGILYWLMTFITITVPTLLFTLFSTSLTFTMNATTL